MMKTYRILHARMARTKIRVPRVWAWHIGLKPQDIFQASYPRSGSTWLRFMLFQILRGEEAGFSKIDKCIPEIESHRGVPPLLPGGGRLIKTHEQYRKDYARAVFLVRDVRDVFLSIYARATGAGLTDLVSKGDFDSFLMAFLTGKAVQQGTWQAHTRSWLDSPPAKNGNLLVVRYEDLRRNPEPVLGNLLEFLGVTPDFRVIRKAIEDNSLQQMRAKEDKALKAGEESALLGCHKNAEGEDGRFVRKGKVGGWRSQLTDAQIQIFNKYAGDMLATLGYDSAMDNEQQVQSPVSVLNV
jgi:Sulfotransferase domain